MRDDVVLGLLGDAVQAHRNILRDRLYAGSKERDLDGVLAPDLSAMCFRRAGDPERAGAVLVEVNYGVVAEALGVGGVVAIGAEAVARRTEPIEAAAVCADP